LSRNDEIGKMYMENDFTFWKNDGGQGDHPKNGSSKAQGDLKEGMERK
jgi:hypothetical protein